MNISEVIIGSNYPQTFGFEVELREDDAGKVRLLVNIHSRTKIDNSQIFGLPPTTSISFNIEE